jgi:hypothetical protein
LLAGWSDVPPLHPTHPALRLTHTCAVPQRALDAAARGEAQAVFASDDSSAVLLGDGILIGWGDGVTGRDGEPPGENLQVLHHTAPSVLGGGAILNELAVEQVLRRALWWELA